MIDYKKKYLTLKNINDVAVMEALLSGPKTRRELQAMTAMTDRSIRACIERLRNLGIAIVSNSRGAGYKLAETELEVKSFVADMNSRASKAWRTARKVSVAYGLRDQVAMEAMS